MLWAEESWLEVVSELIELSNVIADIYDAALDPALWQQALATISGYVGGTSAVLFWHDAATEQSEALFLFNEIPEYTKLYFEKYLPMNPMFPAAAFVDAGIVTSTADIMPYKEFVTTRFFKEWVEPQNIVDALAVNLEKGVTRSSLINVRTSTPINDDMRQRMTALVPHLQRAVVIGRLFSLAKQNEQALTQTLDGIEAAVFIVAADGAVSFASDTAKKMLEAATVVRQHGNIFHAVAFDADRLLHQVFADAQQGDASIGARGVAIPLADAALDRWFAHVLPLTSGRRQQTGNDLTAVAAVFVRKTAPNVPLPLETIAKAFALRPSEIRVLNALTKVQGVRELATFLGISEATVKTHLQSLFRKTGTSRQSALVQLASGS